MYDVLFICYGNVGRSQFAEGFYNALVRPGGAISAGTHPPPQYTHPSSPNIQVMREEGIDISSALVKGIERENVDAARSIVSFLPRDWLPEYVAQRQDLHIWPVDDPQEESIETRRRIRDEIKQRVLELRVTD